MSPLFFRPPPWLVLIRRISLLLSDDRDLTDCFPAKRTCPIRSPIHVIFPAPGDFPRHINSSRQPVPLNNCFTAYVFSTTSRDLFSPGLVVPLFRRRIKDLLSLTRPFVHYDVFNRGPEAHCPQNISPSESNPLLTFRGSQWMSDPFLNDLF